VSPDPDIPAWERLLAAERHLQAILPSAVLVGGTAAALHVRHRVSLDGDHVLADLRDHFDDVLATLEAVAGWETARIRPRRLVPPWNDWAHVASRGRSWARVLAPLPPQDEP
jgi:hypothetical protein